MAKSILRPVLCPKSNTFEAQQMEPLPFREVKRYGEPFPDTVEMREYRERCLTRIPR